MCASSSNLVDILTMVNSIDFWMSQFKGEGHDGYHWQMWGARGCYALRCYICTLFTSVELVQSVFWCQRTVSFKHLFINFNIKKFQLLSSSILFSLAYGIFLLKLMRYMRIYSSCECFILRAVGVKRKRRRSDSVLWQKTLYLKKIRKPMHNSKTRTKTSFTQLLRTDLGRSVGVTTVIQLVLLNRFTGTQPSH